MIFHVINALVHLIQIVLHAKMDSLWKQLKMYVSTIKYVTLHANNVMVHFKHNAFNAMTVF